MNRMIAPVCFASGGCLEHNWGRSRQWHHNDWRSKIIWLLLCVNSRFLIPPKERSGSNHKARALEANEASCQMSQLTKLTESSKYRIYCCLPAMKEQSTFRPDQHIERRDLLIRECWNNRLLGWAVHVKNDIRSLGGMAEKCWGGMNATWWQCVSFIYTRRWSASPRPGDMIIYSIAFLHLFYSRASVSCTICILLHLEKHMALNSPSSWQEQELEVLDKACQWV